MKRTPLLRRTSIRESYLRKLKAEGIKTIWSIRNGPPKRKKPLKKVSRSQRERLKKYYAIRNDFLKDNPVCAVCLLIPIDPPNRASEVHHCRGRNGNLLFDTRFFAACCRDHREYIHDNPKWSREVGLLASAPEWGISDVSADI